MRTMLLIFTALFCLSQVVNGADGSISSSEGLSPRSEKRLGVGIGVGDPYPALLGAKAYYNALDFLRTHVGYGQVEVTTSISFNGDSASTGKMKATTFGTGVTGFVPGWSFSPTVGLAWAYLSVDGDGAFKVQGFDRSGGHLYGSLGVDWQLSGGFQLGTGFNFALGGGGDPALYANAGWFFSI